MNFDQVRCSESDREILAGHAHVPYPDTEYEYFEHRGGMARPMVGPPGPGPGAPLLPPVKYNEEVRIKVLVQ